MTVDRNNAAVVSAPSNDDDHEAPEVEARRRSNQRPHCTKCGRFEPGPGGAGFGEGHWYCDGCAVRLDFKRGDGSAR